MRYNYVTVLYKLSKLVVVFTFFIFLYREFQSLFNHAIFVIIYFRHFGKPVTIFKIITI